MVNPIVDSARVIDLLRDQFGQPPQNLAPLDTGLVGRVFSFDVGGRGYVIKFVAPEHAGSIKKEMLIQRLAAGSSVPIPPCIHTGAMGEFSFAITPRIPGRLFSALSFAEYGEIVPAIIENIDAIGRIDVSATSGYGDFDGDGVGRFETWQECLLDVARESPPGTFYSHWRHLFDESFLDRDYFEEVDSAMSDLLRFTPSDRHLIHSDYGYTNTIADNGQIVAVLDWANALIGDFLYDVAWMDFYAPRRNYRELFRDHYTALGRSLDHYDERVLCYQCHINLDNQRWLAVSNNPATYGWHRARIMELLGRGPAAGPPPA